MRVSRAALAVIALALATMFGARAASADAICNDGTRSSADGSGACSHHGGGDYWLDGRGDPDDYETEYDHGSGYEADPWLDDDGGFVPDEGDYETQLSGRGGGGGGSSGDGGIHPLWFLIGGAAIWGFWNDKRS